MKVFVLLPLAALLFTVAVSGDEDDESNTTPEPNNVEVSLPSGNEPSSDGYSVSAGNEPSSDDHSVSVGTDTSDDDPSVSYGESPQDYKPINEQSGNYSSVQYGGKNQTSNSSGSHHHQHGQHYHEYHSHGGHGSRHASHRACDRTSHHHGGHGRLAYRRNSSHASNHGTRHAGHQGSLSERLSSFGNISKNVSGPSSSVNLENVAKNVPSVPSGTSDLEKLQGQEENAEN